MSQQQQQLQMQPLLLFSDLLPTDVWAEAVLQMLDARDVINLPQQSLVLPPGAAFVAKRVLEPPELEWFAERDIPVTLLAQVRVVVEGFSTEERPARIWMLNGEVHRDGDLPAIECADGTREWYVRGKKHRENGLPAIGRSSSSNYLFSMSGRRRPRH